MGLRNIPVELPLSGNCEISVPVEYVGQFTFFMEPI